MRLIIFLLLCFLFYKIFKWILKDNIYRKMDNSSEGSEEMVKDTECNRYILKKSSKSIEIKGETFYFCSDECLKKFKKKKK